ncbi:MAG: DUF397 domain-containing protein [Pseudonocardia sp.]
MPDPRRRHVAEEQLQRLGGNGTDCVEVAFLPDGDVAIRDTKDRTVAPHRYTAAEWDTFVFGVRAGEFDRP